MINCSLSKNTKYFSFPSFFCLFVLFSFPQYLLFIDIVNLISLRCLNIGQTKQDIWRGHIEFFIIGILWYFSQFYRQNNKTVTWKNNQQTIMKIIGSCSSTFNVLITFNFIFWGCGLWCYVIQCAFLIFSISWLIKIRLTSIMQFNLTTWHKLQLP